MRQRSRTTAFTLLELVLVLMVLGTVAAIVAPTLRGWSRGSRLRDATREFIASTRWARSQAVCTGKVHRLTVQSGGWTVQVQEGEQFVSPGGGPVDKIELPAGYSLSAELEGDGASDAIDFYPTGRLRPAKVTIVSDEGRAREIVARSPSEMFAEVDGQEARP